MEVIINQIQFFLIGICIGSFLNVIIFRLPESISIVGPRSFCPNCKSKISWKQNIPIISWLFLKGRCFYCFKRISIRYPAIEFLTGILFIIFSNSNPILYNGMNNSFVEKIFSWSFLSILIVISFIDLRHFWIPQSLINFGFLLGFINLLTFTLSSENLFIQSIFLKFIFTSIGTYFLFEFLRIISRYFYKKEAMGKGDSKLASMMAVWLGPLGILLAIGITYVTAAIYLVITFQLKKTKRGQIIPLAPFLSIGGLTVWHFGNKFLVNVFYGLNI